MEEEKGLIISRHCKERYVERVKGKDDHSDIALFVNMNEERIEADINKMATYGEVIYTGSLKDKNIVTVILNGTWVLLTDKNITKAITMYKIDFGLGEEFNKDFIAKMMVRIQEAMIHLDAAKRDYASRQTAYKDAIEECDNLIKDYKGRINKLNAQKEAYQELLDNSSSQIELANDEVKTEIMNLVCKKEF